MSNDRRTERETFQNIELLQAAQQRDWLSHPNTIALLKRLDDEYITAMNLADSTRELKYLDRAYAFREVIEQIRNSNK